ncbi:MAG: TIGR01777 family protein [bacterium]|nr:TIGR01777 family protein [Candidatus Kapabacteria bacterium]
MASENRRVIVTGANGMIGSRIVKQLLNDGDTVFAFVRDVERSRARLPREAQLVPWSHNATTGEWRECVASADAIVNLAGATVGRRWTDEQKHRIRESRIVGTRNLVDAIISANRPPKVLVNSSAVGYYGANPVGEITEESPAGDDFLAMVCRDWEAEAEKAREAGARVVRVRSGVVLDAHEGPFPRMVLPFKLFAGGPLGSGNQPLPWIHIDDEVAAIIWALNDAKVDGAINATSPGIVNNREFSRALGRTMHRPSVLPTPEFAIKLLLGEGSVIVTGGQWAVPHKLLSMGFRFRHPIVQKALDDLLRG